MLLWGQNVLEYLGWGFFSHNVFSEVISSEIAIKKFQRIETLTMKRSCLEPWKKDTSLVIKKKTLWADNKKNLCERRHYVFKK